MTLLRSPASGYGPRSTNDEVAFALPCVEPNHPKHIKFMFKMEQNGGFLAWFGVLRPIKENFLFKQIFLLVECLKQL
jgi:hypothetical protein